jgi:hypothetical protein
MAKVSLDIVGVLRRAAKKIESSAEYQWGHMGACNCGFLAQEVTRLTKAQIHQRAMQGYGDWNEQLNDYCPTSGLPMDDLISNLLAFGFDIDDLKHLERLSDKRILEAIPQDQRWLRQNIKADVVKYLFAWANLIEDEITKSIKIELPEATLSEQEA